MNQQKLSIFYDGYCPLCAHYVRHARLKRDLDISLTDLREHPEKVAQFNAQNLNVDDGMIAILDGITYHGAEALHVLALMSTPSGIFNRINRFVFSHRTMARIFYPALVAGRNLLLTLLGRRKINSL